MLPPQFLVRKWFRLQFSGDHQTSRQSRLIFPLITNSLSSRLNGITETVRPSGCRALYFWVVYLTFMLSRDVSDALCLSLACYSCTDVQALLGRTPDASTYPHIDELVACGSTWPDVAGAVSVNVRYKEGRNTFPLSPPYFVSPISRENFGTLFMLRHASHAGHTRQHVRCHRIPRIRRKLSAYHAIRRHVAMDLCPACPFSDCETVG